MASTEISRRVWQFVQANRPHIVRAWLAIDDYLVRHPQVSATARQNLLSGRDRWVQAQGRKTPEAQLRATLSLVEGLAGDVPRQPSGPEAQAADERARKVQQIRQALTLAEARTGPERDRMLARLRDRTDALVSEAFEALVPDEATGGGGSAVSPRG